MKLLFKFNLIFISTLATVLIFLLHISLLTLYYYLRLSSTSTLSIIIPLSPSRPQQKHPPIVIQFSPLFWPYLWIHACSILQFFFPVSTFLSIFQFSSQFGPYLPTHTRSILSSIPKFPPFLHFYCPSIYSTLVWTNDYFIVHCYVFFPFSSLFYVSTYNNAKYIVLDFFFNF